MTSGNIQSILRKGFAAGAVAALALGGGSAVADDFYKNKQLNLLVGYAPGGGYDTYARTFARYLPNHLPGSPTIIIKNMPGAGSMRVANYLYASAPRDGREIGAVGREIPTATLLKVPNAQFKSAEFTWIGSLASGQTFCVAWHEAPVKTAKDMFEKQFIAGGSTGQSPTVTVPLILNNLLGTKVKLIAGYTGGADLHLAMERGEIQGRCAVTIPSLNASRPDWIRDKKVNFLIEISLADERRIPDVPRIIEFAKSDEDKARLEVLLASGEWQRPIVAPPGLPAARTATLRAAFDKTVSDPGYMAEIEKQKLDAGPMKGEKMEALIKRLETTPDHIVQAAIAAASKTEGTEMAKVVAPVEKASGKITKVENGGRKVSFEAGAKKGSLNVSTSGTKVSIAGSEAKRGQLKDGMNCAFEFQGETAKVIACK